MHPILASLFTPIFPFSTLILLKMRNAATAFLIITYIGKGCQTNVNSVIISVKKYLKIILFSGENAENIITYTAISGRIITIPVS
jgi:hypothetical protein